MSQPKIFSALVPLLCSLVVSPFLSADNGGDESDACNNGGTTCPPGYVECEPGQCCPIVDSCSVLNPYSGLYIHDAIVYRLTDLAAGSGCIPCGASGRSAMPKGLPSIDLRRYYRSRNGGYYGSLGNNHFLSVDMQLRIDWRNSDASDVTVRLFDPAKPIYKRYFTEKAGADAAIDGVLHEATGNSRDVRMFDAHGVLTSIGTQGVTVQVTETDGTVWTYEMVDAGFGATARAGRLLQVTERTGVIREQYTYVYPAAATLTALGNDRARLWILAQVKAADGTTARFTYDTVNKRGGRFPVTRIDLPNGASTSYGYSSAGDLTTIALPDGSTATFTVSYDTTLQKVKTVISDPGAEPGHQFKTVWWTGSSFRRADGTTVPQAYGQLRRIDNGAGETVQVIWAGLASASNAAPSYIWHANSGLVKYEVSSAAILPTAKKYAPSFVLGQDPKAALFTEFDLFATDTTHEVIPAQIDALGHRKSATFDYTTRNNHTVTGFDGQTRSATFNVFGFPLQATDPAGRPISYTYDASGNRTAKTSGSGSEISTWRWEYDARGLVSAEIDARGNRTDYRYDANGHLTGVIEPADAVGGTRAARSFSYNAASQMTTETDASGRLVQYAYDARGRLISTTYADGSRDVMTYGTGTLSGLVVAQVNRNGAATTFGFDAAGRCIHTEIASGTPEVQIEDCTWVSGSLSHKASCVRAGDTTRYAYDGRGRLLSTQVMPNLNTTLTSTTTYDPRGLATGMVDPYGRATFTRFDAASRPVRTIRELVPGGFPLDQRVRDFLASQPQSLVGIALGTPLLGGSSNVSESTVTISGAGTDIWGTADEGEFTRLALLSDGMLTARLTSQTRQSEWSKAGLMIRASDSPNAAFIDIVVSEFGVTVQKRQLDGAGTTTGANIGIALPVSLKMAQVGSDAIASYSVDGVTWIEAERMAMILTPQSRIGLAITSHRPTALSHAVFDQVTMTTTGAVAASVMALAQEQVLATATRDLSPNPGYVLEDTFYDPSGLPVQRIDGRGIAAITTYDSQGRVLSMTEAAGTSDTATTTFAYDANGNRIRVIDPRGMITFMTYTGRNLVATSTEGYGLTNIAALTSYAYSPTRKVASMTDPLGRLTTNTYGICCDRLMAVTDPSGFMTKYAYDFVGNRTSVTDANNLTSIMAYDGRNRPFTVTNAAAEMTRITYLEDASGLPAASGLGLGAGADGSAVIVTNPAGEPTIEIRDGLGRPLRRIDALGHAINMAYDMSVPDGGVTLIATTQTDALAHTVTSLVDGAGRIRIRLDALAKRSTTGFDANGNRVTWRDANGVGQDCTFDGRNRDVVCTDSAGAVTRKSYDANGNLLTVTDALNGTDSNIYDLRNRKTSTTDRIGATTGFEYDLVSNLTRITDAEHSQRPTDPTAGVTDYVYEARNLLSSELFPNGQQGRTRRLYTYDAGRRLTSRTVQAVTTAGTPIGASEATGYLYDSANRLITRRYADAKNDGFTYDKASRLTTATSARYINQVRRGYDAAGRLTRESLTFTSGSEIGIELPVVYTYDDANRVTSLTTPENGLTRRDYTARNELFHVWDGAQVVTTQTYDDAGRLTRSLAGNSLSETRTYVPQDNLVATIKIPGVTDFAYTYDALKRKLTELDGQNTDQTQRFGYDAQSRVTDWKRTGTLATDPAKATQTWLLSPVGDWKTTTVDGITQSRTNSSVHEILTINGLTLTNDFKGNLTKDDQGQLFAWDPENRLLSASNLKQGQGESATYGYDALGRRVRKSVSTHQPAKADGTPTPDKVVPTTFILAGAQEVLEVTGDLTALNDPSADPEDAGVEPFNSATGTGARGSLLPEAAQRINFQPASTDTPDGWMPDLGAVGSAPIKGWNSAVSPVDRDHLGRPLYDSFAPIGTSTWQIPVSQAGAYAVTIMCGDADSRAQTNHLVVEGIPVRDQTPYDGQAVHGYETGSFDGYALTVIVNDGMLTISAAIDALNPKIDFIEIGKPGSAIDAATVARVQAAADKATRDTAKPKPKTPPTVKRNQWGTYVDDLVSYTVRKPRKSDIRYYSHSNNLYSIAATTNASGHVVERYSYNAYGASILKSSTNIIIAKSAVGQDRGFTGYKVDLENGEYYARSRMYSPKLGRFISEDTWKSTTRNYQQQYRPYPKDGYPNGWNMYEAYFIPNNVDPTGMFPGCDWSDCDSGGTCVLGGGHGPMRGSCGWGALPNGSRNCGCRGSSIDWYSVVVTCGTCVGVAAVIGLGILLLPVEVPAAAACAAVGAAVLSIQKTPSSPPPCRNCNGPII